MRPFDPRLLTQVPATRKPVVALGAIGAGQGLATIALAFAVTNLVVAVVEGREVHTPGVGSLLKQIDERGLTNLRVFQHDAVDVLEQMIAPVALAGAHIFIPDPWPKKRHHILRLFQHTLVQPLP